MSRKLILVGDERAAGARLRELSAPLPYRAALEASRDGGVRMLNRRTFAMTQIAKMTKAA